MSDSDDESIISTGTEVINENHTDVIRNLRDRQNELLRLGANSPNSPYFNEYMLNMREITRPRRRSLYQRMRRIVNAVTARTARINPN